MENLLVAGRRPPLRPRDDEMVRSRRPERLRERRRHVEVVPIATVAMAVLVVPAGDGSSSCRGWRPVSNDAVDSRRVTVIPFKNGAVEMTGLAASVLNHAGTGEAWLATRIALHGGRLNAIDVKLPASFSRPTPTVAGDISREDYGPLVTVAFRLA